MGGIAAHLGKHLIKAASTTQSVIPLSTVESKFYAVVRGTATALGMQSMTRDYGHGFTVALEKDSVSGCDMSPRVGAGKVRHTVVVCAGRFTRARSNDSQ